MLTGFFRNTTNEAKSVRLIATDTSVVEIQDPEGNNVSLEKETIIANMGAQVAPVSAVIDLKAELVID